MWYVLWQPSRVATVKTSTGLCNGEESIDSSLLWINQIVRLEQLSRRPTPKLNAVLRISRIRFYKKKDGPSGREDAVKSLGKPVS